jgi:hypothetical protein
MEGFEHGTRGVSRLPRIYDIGGSEEQHREDHSMAKLLRLSLATLTLIVFFYSTTLLTSYFYPLNWAPIAF